MTGDLATGTKPLLIGMNNPISDDPAHALYPVPKGSAGHRLWQMMPEGTTRKAYIEAFDRVNLLPGREWDPALAKEIGPSFWISLADRPGMIVVLGKSVREALGLPPAEACIPMASIQGGRTWNWVAVPHPSGMNRWYNYPKNVALVRGLLADLMKAPRGAPPITL